MDLHASAAGGWCGLFGQMLCSPSWRGWLGTVRRSGWAVCAHAWRSCYVSAIFQSFCGWYPAINRMVGNMLSVLVLRRPWLASWSCGLWNAGFVALGQHWNGIISDECQMRAYECGSKDPGRQEVRMSAKDVKKLLLEGFLWVRLSAETKKRTQSTKCYEGVWVRMNFMKTMMSAEWVRTFFKTYNFLRFQDTCLWNFWIKTLEYVAVFFSFR